MLLVERMTNEQMLVCGLITTLAKPPSPDSLLIPI
jgi:hypothetical protein